MKLFFILLGCKPKDRNTEQHDVCFCIGKNLHEVIPQLNSFWPEGFSNMHIDAWREVKTVDNFNIKILPKDAVLQEQQKLFFANLGGYKNAFFEELHYKCLLVAKDIKEAKTKLKQTPFFKNNTQPHVDNLYEIDEVLEVAKLLPTGFEQYQICIEPQAENMSADEIQLGYLPLSKIKKG